ncbi:hypothetical protein [Hufsiella ginkgonis]|uniref:Uncharacterized protein n=1 Tax=Hufsiella ginkgonis TaxID=2695274 RepID=A0A7K1XZV1_9SPHI|nr:hypothetical protein [Hufsiella ginkgonis]MXV16503.1 hypothetical protein [Hufsiella ginkgonis]
MNVILIKLSGFAITFVFFFLIRFLLARQRSFSDFFIGESGAYSLSRVQIVSWVYIIISFQISLLVATATLGAINKFDVLFPEEIMWLLGLSSASYLVVKGATVDMIIKQQKVQIKVRKLSDLIVGDSGLDFTRFQFLIWTLVGIFLYLSHCNFYIESLFNPENSGKLGTLLSEANPDMPSVSWSFIVLMGLSQGTYIGKKLIPEFKAAEFKEDRCIELNRQVDLLGIQIAAKQEIVQLAKPVTEAGIVHVAALKEEIVHLQSKKVALEAEVRRIKN